MPQTRTARGTARHGTARGTAQSGRSKTRSSTRDAAAEKREFVRWVLSRVSRGGKVVPIQGAAQPSGYLV